MGLRSTHSYYMYKLLSTWVEITSLPQIALSDSESPFNTSAIGLCGDKYETMTHRLPFILDPKVDPYDIFFKGGHAGGTSPNAVLDMISRTVMDASSNYRKSGIIEDDTWMFDTLATPAISKEDMKTIIRRLKDYSSHKPDANITTNIQEIEVLEHEALALMTNARHTTLILKLKVAGNRQHVIFITSKQSEQVEDLINNLAYIIYKAHKGELNMFQDILKEDMSTSNKEKYIANIQPYLIEKIKKLEKEKLNIKLDVLDKLDDAELDAIETKLKNKKALEDKVMLRVDQIRRDIQKFNKELLVYKLEGPTGANSELREYIEYTTTETEGLFTLESWRNDRDEVILAITVKNKLTMNITLLKRLRNSIFSTVADLSPERYKLLIRATEGEYNIPVIGKLNINTNTGTISGGRQGGNISRFEGNMNNPHWARHRCIGDLADPMGDAVRNKMYIPMYQLAVNAVGELNLDDGIVCGEFLEDYRSGGFNRVDVYDSNRNYLGTIEEVLKDIKKEDGELEVPF